MSLLFLSAIGHSCLYAVNFDGQEESVSQEVLAVLTTIRLPSIGTTLRRVCVVTLSAQSID